MIAISEAKVRREQARIARARLPKDAWVGTSRTQKNMHPKEQIGSGIAGGLPLGLGTWALQRKSLGLGGVAIAFGAALVYRALSGRCMMYKALGVNTNKPA